MIWHPDNHLTEVGTLPRNKRTQQQHWEGRLSIHTRRTQCHSTWRTALPRYRGTTLLGGWIKAGWKVHSSISLTIRSSRACSTWHERRIHSSTGHWIKGGSYIAWCYVGVRASLRRIRQSEHASTTCSWYTGIPFLDTSLHRCRERLRAESERYLKKQTTRMHK